MIDLGSFVKAVEVAPEMRSLRDDYKALIVAIDNLENGVSNELSRSWLRNASDVAIGVEHTLHLDAWRSAYRSFDVKPQKFRPSFDALIRRASAGLPEVNRVVDAYNAISVKYGLPIGGENIDAYQGSLRLVRARGVERFDTFNEGRPTVETVDAGEVIWRDDAGATCRRWNWRQCIRTRINHDTTRAFFLLECLDPFPEERLYQAWDELLPMIASAASTVETRLIEFDHNFNTRTT